MADVALQTVLLPGFRTTFVALDVAVGGHDRAAAIEGENRSVPAGAAHALEHLVFSGRQGGLVRVMGDLGASVNAMTSGERTCFYASGVGTAQAQAEALLESVFHPDFDEATWVREQKVIEDEIAMVENDPGAHVDRALREALYPTHPVRDDVAGARSDVRALTPGMLKAFHSTHYVADTSRLIVAGDVSPATLDAICAYARARVPATPRAVPRPQHVEREAVNTTPLTLEAPCDLGQFALAVRLDPSALPDESWPRLRMVASLAAWLEMVMGPMNEAIECWQERSVIDDSFSAALMHGRDHLSIWAQGYATDPQAALEAMRHHLSEALDGAHDDAVFDAVRAQMHGRLLRRLDSVDGAGHAQVAVGAEGVSVTDMASLYAKIACPTPTALAALGASLANCATVVLHPM